MDIATERLNVQSLLSIVQFLKKHKLKKDVCITYNKSSVEHYYESNFA